MNSVSLPCRCALPLAAALALVACGSAGDEADQQDQPEPRGSYAIDAATGETSARYTDARGAVTTLRSGRRVPVALPQGFTVFPDAQVTNNTRVDRPQGRLVLIDFTSAAEPAELAAFYRRQAEAAGITVGTSLQSGPTMLIGGQGDDGADFSLTATRQGDQTRAQLSLGRGIE